VTGTGTGVRTGIRVGRLGSGAAGLAGLLVLVEAAPRLGLVSADHLPPSSTIGVALAGELVSPGFWSALGSTLLGWGIGLLIAAGLALTAGVIIGSVPLLREATASTIEFLRPIPSVALIPLAALMYGSEIGSTLLLVGYAAFWQLLIQVLYGVADVDPVARDTARAYRLSRWDRITFLTIPSALPYIMTGLRLAAAVALILAITAELIIGGPGLGREIGTARSSGAVPTVYALVVAAGLIGVGINAAIRLLERHVLAWHPSVRGEATR
jgi:ABC-type nitrate/sulfonate/bicarbonate transport system permease component